MATNKHTHVSPASVGLAQAHPNMGTFKGGHSFKGRHYYKGGCCYAL